MTEYEKQIAEVESEIRELSLYDKNMTDILVNAAVCGADKIRDIILDWFAALLDTVNHEAFHSTEAYISYLKQEIEQYRKKL